MLTRIPATLPETHRNFIDRALRIFSADPRVLGVAAAGSFADDKMDRFSDIDLTIVVEPTHATEILSERTAIAASLGELLASFTGEHVGEPRLLICLYGSPLLHVDLKFVALTDAADRVDEPAVIWEREGRLTEAMAQRSGKYPCPDMQWVEDRFWVWVHYAATKIGRGEFFETLEFLSFLRANVLSPLGLQALGLRPSGVRRIEQLAPQLANELRNTVATLEPHSLIAALKACITLYEKLVDTNKTLVDKKTAARIAAIEYLNEIELLRV